MLQALFNTLMGIGNYIQAFAKYMVNMVLSLGHLLELLTYFVGNIPRYFSWLPAEYVTLIGFICTIAVLMKVLGREG